MTNTWLVMADVDAVQSYLFTSLHLREAAGASALLVEHDEDVPAIASRLDPHSDTLFSAGGTALVAFSDGNAAARFPEEVRVALAQRAPGATISFGGPCSTSGGFVAARDDAARALERNKRLGTNPGETVECPLALRCEGCGREAAEGGARVKVGNDERWLGATCLSKHAARVRGGWLGVMRGRPGWDNVGSDRMAADSSALADDQLLGIVVADADGVGERLRAISDIAAYRDFSRMLAVAVGGGLADAIAATVDPRGTAQLPVEVLYTGGDDVVVACRGDIALPLTRSLVGAFRGRAPSIGMSAAVALVGPTFPFRLAHDLAGALLREAKREARRNTWTEGAIDWVVVTESHADARSVLADRAVHLPATGDMLALSGRPYRAADSGARSIGAFADASKKLVNGFPRNKLFALRTMCSAREVAGPTPPSTTDDLKYARETFLRRYGQWQARVARSAGPAWAAACEPLGITPEQPLWSAGKEYRTPVGDLAEGTGLWGVA